MYPKKFGSIAIDSFVQKVYYPFLCVQC